MIWVVLSSCCGHESGSQIMSSKIACEVAADQMREDFKGSVAERVVITCISEIGG